LAHRFENKIDERADAASCVRVRDERIDNRRLCKRTVRRAVINALLSARADSAIPYGI